MRFSLKASLLETNGFHCFTISHIGKFLLNKTFSEGYEWVGHRSYEGTDSVTLHHVVNNKMRVIFVGGLKQGLMLSSIKGTKCKLCDEIFIQSRHVV